MKRSNASIGVCLAMVCIASHGFANELAANTQQFNKLKSLVGQWEGVTRMGNKEQKVNLEYSLTSGGTAVVEKIFKGTPQEMVTIYHPDGDEVLVTHYCSLGNQPRMRSGKMSDQQAIRFNFFDGTNLDPAKDPHMHNLLVSLPDKDHLKQEWAMFEDGKQKKTTVFEFTRQP